MKLNCRRIHNVKEWCHLVALHSISAFTGLTLERKGGKGGSHGNLMMTKTF